MLDDKFREATLRWFGHFHRRYSEYIFRSMLRMDLPDRRPTGGTKRRFMLVLKEDMKLIGMREKYAEDIVRWTLRGH